jgi:hypothetical protein
MMHEYNDVSKLMNMKFEVNLLRESLIVFRVDDWVNGFKEAVLDLV